MYLNSRVIFHVSSPLIQSYILLHTQLYIYSSDSSKNTSQIETSITDIDVCDNDVVSKLRIIIIATYITW